MSESNSFFACARDLKTRDYPRYVATLFAPPAMRAGLTGLYALGAELRRIPHLVSEPMLAEIRFQWWREAVTEAAEGQTPRRHPVLDLLHDVRVDLVPVIDGFNGLMEERAGIEAVARAAMETDGALQAAAAACLGADETRARKAGTALGLAGFLGAGAVAEDLTGLVADNIATLRSEAAGRITKAEIPVLLPLAARGGRMAMLARMTGAALRGRI